MKNRRNIVELKYPSENPNDIWLKDGKFYRSTSEGWVAIGSEIKYTNKESMIADKPEGGTIGIDKETGETSIYNDVAEQWSPLSGGGVTSITWLELKDKRDAGKLIPGALYRITDYQCTTTQENTQSAGHQFDIVLLALSADKLAEEGWAMMNDNIYDVTFNDGVTKKCYLYGPYDIDGSPNYNLVDTSTLLGYSELLYGEFTIDGNTIIVASAASNDLIEENLAYNYFQNSNLSAWKVWYCLDNDKSRFAWADTTNGKGVIYRMIDEFNNDIKYDFKNIQFKRKLTNGQYDANGTETWCYTLNIWYNDMCQDASIVGNTLPNDEGFVYGVYDNKFGYATAYDLSIDGADTFAFALGDNVVLSFDDDGYQGIYSNTIRDAFHNNTIGNTCYSNTIRDAFHNNTIGNTCYSNTIGNGFSSNTIGNEFSSNMIGNEFNSNIIGNNCYSNTIGNEFVSNTIGDDIGYKNYGNNGVELATKDDIGNIETALNNI